MKFQPLLSVAAAGLILAVAACKQNVADLPARDHAKDGTVVPAALTTTTPGAPKVDPRDLPVAKVDGKPMWAANKSHTAEENAQYQFEHHGSEFGLASKEAYVSKAHDFTAHPPSGAERITRGNGDTLIYDPRDNIFAVVSKEGAPRTLFKPEGGASYWAQQKQELASDDRAGAQRKGATKASRTKDSQG